MDAHDLIDPDTDPTAAYAVDPEPWSALLDRVVATGPPRLTTTPLTGAALASVPTSTPQDVAEAVAGVRSAQPGWAALPLAERAAVLLRLHDLLLAEQSEVLDLVQLETGKARASAFEEVADVAMLARHYARAAGGYLATRRVRGLVPGLTRVRTDRFPVGVVGVISPWNYPLTLSIGDALPALVAGNGVVLKPDSQTPLTALWAADLAERAGLPAGLLRVVVGGGASIGPALIDAVDHVCFTGSTATGRAVAARAGQRLIGASLELGGKNSLYVADDADVQIAAEGAVRACFANTGQLCVSVERLVLHRAIAEPFLHAFLPRVAALRLGVGLDYTADMGSLTTPEQLAKVREHVQDAVDRGATVLSGGRARPDLGPLCHEPTVLDGVPADAACYREETFGPVVGVYRVGSDAEAAELINDTDYGLNASVWTGDVARGRRLAAHLETGSVNVNEGYVATWASTAAPIGGVKASGLGHRHGPEGLWATTRTQTVAVQRGVPIGLGLGRLYGLPGETWTEAFTSVLRAMKRLGMR